MRPGQIDNSGEAHLRMIFEGAVVSSSLETDATFGDVARTLSDLSGHGYGNAVAIDVTLPDATLASHRHSDACVAARTRLVDGGGDRRVVAIWQ